LLPFLSLLLAACAAEQPPCPVAGDAAVAVSAGCFAVAGGELLLVQGFNGKVSLPGGSSEPGESARCTAFRETWEETGLRLVPGKLLRVFDTGFHLYRCDAEPGSGDGAPPPRFEVRDVLRLGTGRFGDYEWRFPEQRDLLRDMLLEEADSTRE
jgi:8-oxo-dGTP pyrophosphatase MutT (NUDIX family)